MVKSRLYGDDKETSIVAQKVLLYVLKDILKILHPFMPFITEEIWQHLPGNNEALIVSSWPYFKDEFVFRESEQGIEYIKTAIKAIRNARAEMNIIPSKKSNIIFVTTDDDISKYIEVGKRYFVNLASAEDIKIFDTKDGLGEENISIVLDKCQVFLPLKELIDYDKEIERLEKEKAKLEDRKSVVRERV